MAAMKMKSGSSNRLKLRRSTAANPQVPDVECGLQQPWDPPSPDRLSTDSSSSSGEDDSDKKGDDRLVRRAADFLADLSPLRRRVARFVASPGRSVPDLPDRCAAECVAVAAPTIGPCLAFLVGLPLWIWDGRPAWTFLRPYLLLRHVELIWSCLLQTSSIPVVVGTLAAVALIPLTPKHKGGGMWDRAKALSFAAVANVTRSGWKTSLALAVFFSSVVIVNTTLQTAVPHIIWNPFLWGWYRVYLPENITPALKGACLKFEDHVHGRRPLCLGEQQWNELSSGQLSSYNPKDVLAVQRGLDYLQNHSGGILINALARNVADAIPALRQNMDGLAPFFKDPASQLSLVIFENDSDDGTRDMFKAWAKDESQREKPRYKVDLMGCGPKNLDCKLGVIDRYDNMNLFSNPKASGVGKLGHFRNVLLDYVLSQDRYKDYTHMIVLDVDLGTSISPLGLLHTLGLDDGLARDHVIATSSSQTWPGTLGTVIPPYDKSAFRANKVESNRRVRGLHSAFCQLMPEGDRWRNMCDAASPMQQFLVQSANDPANHHGKPYEVTSAFNGLTSYPLALIRERGERARYDSGDDGQRCEHVGLNLSLGKTVYVNPKWSMNLKPDNPGGPTGWRTAMMLITAVVGRHNVILMVVVGNTLFFFAFVYAWWRIGSSVRGLVQLWRQSGENELEKEALPGSCYKGH
ncbi:hypothetical protein ACHAWF_004218 [Thalassiosira exigua]